ncbi:L protein [Wenzhou pacific spadenose shark paramyxovirus]|uniref:RNA-directed RNA polymerase L n=1 Tax=Wenzhou pacific spadenose shark paramyxovirus TaxID=2116452 RepID=A0A2P1GMY7_9MONO|nr:L protein [Wenzhou pacific spadenose shark paramyxovirus]AVM87362.1 L protein [Wenzhou pacific spadenose shark paramyxovirus]
MSEESITVKEDFLLYPEVHLDSPIVLARRDLIAFMAGLPKVIEIENNTPLLFATDQYSAMQRDSIGIIAAGIRRLRIHGTADWRKSYGLMGALFRLTDTQLTRRLLKIESHAFNESLLGSDGWKRYIKMMIDLNLCTESHRKHLVGKIPSLRARIENLKQFSSSLVWLTVKQNLRKIMKESSEGRVSRFSEKPLILSGNRHVFYLFTGVVIVHFLKTNVATMLSYEQVLMISDVTESRLSVAVSLPLMTHVRPIFSVFFEQVTLHFDTLFPVLGNNIYSYIKMVEALVYGGIAAKEPHPESGHFLIDTLDTIIGVLEDYLQDDVLIKIEEFWRDWFDVLNVIEIAELMALYRYFGHPFLEPDKACAKVKAHMLAPKTLDRTTLEETYAMWCILLINGYMKAHQNMWPPIEIDPVICPKLHRMKTQGQAILHDEVFNLTEELMAMEWTQFEEVLLDEDLSIFMKDRAVNPPASYWDCMFYKPLLPYKPPPFPGTRRLSAHFLEDSEFTPEKYINYVVSGDYLADREFSISYSLKEREVNADGRIFGKMTPMMRGAQVIAEALIANGIGKYFDANGMVKSEKELLESLHRMSAASNIINTSEKPTVFGDARGPDQTDFQAQQSSNAKYQTIAAFLTTDIQKYCLNFREETTNLFTYAQDQIYGLYGFFGWMHRRLKRSWIYVGDPYYPPSTVLGGRTDEPGDSEIGFWGPLGGIEGFCQKTWTLISIASIHLAAVKVGVRVKAMIQGDNQNVAVTKRVSPLLPEEEKERIILEATYAYADQLREDLANLGLNLKRSETLISQRFFVYSKRLYHSGSLLPQALKALSRVNLWSETLLDEARTACSTIATIGSKGINQGANCHAVFLIVNWFTCRQIIHGLDYRIDSMIPKDVKDLYFKTPGLVRLMALLPASLGGFSYLCHSKLFVRNIGDPLVASIADCKRYVEYRLMRRTVLLAFLNQTPSNCTWLQLATDPYALNIPVTRSISVLIERITQENILASSNNPMLKDIFHQDYQQEDEQYAEFLLNREVIYPRVANALLALLPTGERRALAAILETTKTIIRQSLQRGGIDPRTFHSLVNYESRQFTRFLDIVTSCNKQDGNQSWIIKTVDLCSLELAHFARRLSWVHLIGTRPLDGLETPDLIESTRVTYLTTSGNCQQCISGSGAYLWAHYPSETILFRNTGLIHYQRDPYVGSETSERTMVSLLRMDGLSRAVKRSIRICLVYTWVFGNTDEAWENAFKLASTRSAITLEQLKILTPMPTSLNVTHRLHEQCTQMRFMSARPSVASRFITMSTDRIVTWSEVTNRDTNIIYQNIMLLGCSLIEDMNQGLIAYTGDPVLMHIHIQEHCCVRFLEPKPFGSEPTLPDLWKPSPSNKLIYDCEGPKGLGETRVQKLQGVLDQADFSNWPSDSIMYLGSVSVGVEIARRLIGALNDGGLRNEAIVVAPSGINLLTAFMVLDLELILKSFARELLLQLSYQITANPCQDSTDVLIRVFNLIDMLSTTVLSGIAGVINHPMILDKIVTLIPISDLRSGPNFVSSCDSSLLRSIVKFYIEEAIHELDTKGYFKKVPVFISDPDYEANIIVSTKCKALTLYLRSRYGNVRLEDRPIQVISQQVRSEFEDFIASAHVLYGGRRVFETLNSLSLRVYYGSPHIVGLMAITELKSRIYHGKFMPKVTTLPRLSIRSIQEINISYTDYFSCWTIRYPVGCIVFTPYDPLRMEDKDTTEIPSVDFSYIRYRTYGCSSTSFLKLVSFFYSLNHVGFKVRTALCLGEGSGSIAAAIVRIWKPRTLFFNTLIKDGDYSSERVQNFVPSEYMRWWSEVNREVYYDEGAQGDPFKLLTDGTEESTNLTQLRCHYFIRSTIGKDLCDIITCDMEDKNLSGFTERWRARSLVLKTAWLLLRRRGTVIIKLYASRDNIWRFTARLAATLFNNVQIYRSMYSNPNGLEFYLILSCPKIIEEGIVSDQDESIPIILRQGGFHSEDEVPSSLKSCSERLVPTSKLIQAHNDFVEHLGISSNLLYLEQVIFGPLGDQMVNRQFIDKSITIVERQIKTMISQVKQTGHLRKEKIMHFAIRPDRSIRDYADRLCLLQFLAKIYSNVVDHVPSSLTTQVHIKQVGFREFDYQLSKPLQKILWKIVGNITPIKGNDTTKPREPLFSRKRTPI